jgi:O-antigen/teichoic acid export membrane protein
VLSTLTNAGLSIVVARSVDKVSFGAFSSALLLFTLFIAVGRTGVGQVLSIRYASVRGRAAWSQVACRALGVTVSLAVPCGAVLMLVGAVMSGPLRWPLIAVGATLPALLLQDTVRSIFFAQSRADLAALNDGLWAVIQFPVMAVLGMTGGASSGILIFVWGASAGVCVLVGLLQLRAVPRPSVTAGWLRAHRDLLTYMLPETLINTGGVQAAYLGIGWIVNLAATGAVLAARQIFNPLAITSQALGSFAMPEISRRVHLSSRQRWILALGLSGIQAAASLAYLGLVLLVPTSIGRALFGDTWSGAHAVLVPVGLFSAVAGASMGPFLVAAAMGHARRTFRVSMLSTVMSVTGMPIGAILGGTPGAAWGLFAGQAVELPFWFLVLRTAIRLGPTPHSPECQDRPSAVHP